MAKIRTNFIIKNGIYNHISGLYKIRERKGRNLEVNFTCHPNRWRSTGTNDLLEAEQFAEKMLMQNGRPSDSHKRAMTFRDYAEGFFERDDPDSFYARRKAFGHEPTAKYMKDHQSRLDNYILPAIGDMPITLITSLDLERLYLNCCTKDGEELGDNAKNKVRQTIMRIFEMAMVQNVISSNPASVTQHIRERDAVERKPFEIWEMRKLFPNNIDELYSIWSSDDRHSTAGTPIMWATYFSIMYDTGFRPNEVIALGVDSFKDNGVYTDRSIDNYSGTIKQGIKTSDKGQKFKVGILSEYTKDLIRLRINEIGDEKFLFQITPGKFVRVESANQKLKATLKRAGIPINGRVQYCIRHSFDTNMLNAMDNTMDIKDVQMLMGHTVYRPEYDHRNASNLINALDEKVRDKINGMR